MLRFTGMQLFGLLAVAVPLLSLNPPAEAGGWGGHGGYGHGWGGYGWGGHGWGGGWHGGTHFGLSLSLPLTFGYPAPYPYRYPYPYPYAYAPPPVVVVPAPPPATATSPTYLTPNGRTCREFETRGSVDGRSVPLRGTACLDPDGRWRVAQ